MRNKREKVIVSCKKCGKEFETNSYEIKRGKGRCCSTSCASGLAAINRDSTNSKNPNWKGGFSNTERVNRYREKYPQKHAAHLIVMKAIRNGTLKKELCEICFAEKVEAHHDDYSKPLDVRWLCKKHHSEFHKQNRSPAPLHLTIV